MVQVHYPNGRQKVYNPEQGLEIQKQGIHTHIYLADKQNLTLVLYYY